MFVLLNQAKRFADFPLRQAIILRQFDDWLNPELRLPVRAHDVNVHPGLFAREEVETIAACAKYGRAHEEIILLAKADSFPA
jgi:hypothetical protein